MSYWVCLLFVEIVWFCGIGFGLVMGFCLLLIWLLLRCVIFGYELFGFLEIIFLMWCCVSKIIFCCGLVVLVVCIFVVVGFFYLVLYLDVCFFGDGSFYGGGLFWLNYGYVMVLSSFVFWFDSKYYDFSCWFNYDWCFWFKISFVDYFYGFRFCYCVL